MKRPTSVDPLQHSPSELDRELLASAAGDGPSAEQTERAWLAFAARASALAAVAPPPSPPPVIRGWHRTPRARAAKWLLVGALSGGGLVWLGSRAVSGPPAVTLPPPVSPVTPPSVLPPATPLAAAPPPAAPRNATPSDASAAGTAPSRPAPQAPRTSRRPSQSAAPSAVGRVSPLAREVAALDAARAELAIGAGARALRRIERYRREFPAGELAADADVIAIEALALEGDGAALERAARDFLARYPRDPHVARIREIVARVR